MSNDTIIPISGTSAKIEIEIHGYENAEAIDISDANWLESDLFIKIGPFQGAYKCSLTTSELRQFCDELTGMENGTLNKASLAPCEEAILCDVVTTRLGQAKITGKASNNDCANTTLSFEFESDQSYLRATREAIEIVLSRYPPKA